MEVFDFLKFKLEYIDLNKQFFKINQRKQLAVEQNKISVSERTNNTVVSKEIE